MASAARGRYQHAEGDVHGMPHRRVLAQRLDQLPQRLGRRIGLLQHSRRAGFFIFLRVHQLMVVRGQRIRDQHSQDPEGRDLRQLGGTGTAHAHGGGGHRHVHLL